MKSVEVQKLMGLMELLMDEEDQKKASRRGRQWGDK